MGLLDTPKETAHTSSNHLQSFGKIVDHLQGKKARRAAEWAIQEFAHPRTPTVVEARPRVVRQPDHRNLGYTVCLDSRTGWCGVGVGQNLTLHLVVAASLEQPHARSLLARPQKGPHSPRRLSLAGKYVQPSPQKQRRGINPRHPLSPAARVKGDRAT